MAAPPQNGPVPARPPAKKDLLIHLLPTATATSGACLRPAPAPDPPPAPVPAPTGLLRDQPIQLLVSPEGHMVTPVTS